MMNVPVDPAAPVTARGEARIQAPPEIVWRVLTRIDAWPDWQEAVTSATLLGPLEEGAEFRWKAGGIRFSSRIHTCVPERWFGWTGKTVGASAIHNWTFEGEGGSTTVTVEESLDGVLPKLFKRSFQGSLDAGIRKSLEELAEAVRRR